MITYVYIFEYIKPVKQYVNDIRIDEVRIRVVHQVVSSRLFPSYVFVVALHIIFMGIFREP
jgi:hypothetical protein